MKIYVVGGAVRDKLLNVPSNDTDYVVVGSTKEQMLELGYSVVGNDFPVFLHPETKDEYALARKEVSTGDGYNDFDMVFDPSVTIEEDLLRRDFTMCAIAMDIETGEYIDPFNGISDINNRIIRVTNPNAFVEDPVRILRLARFAAQFPAFSIDKKTLDYARAGDISKATPERVLLDFIKAMKTVKPSRFFDVLLEVGQTHWFKEVFALIGQTQPFKHHMEGDAYVHTMMVLDSAARFGESLEVRFGALVHDFGKGLTPKELLPKHYGHEAAGVKPTHDFCDRIKIDNVLRRVGTRVAKYHMHVHKTLVLNPKTFVKVYEDIKSHVGDAEFIARVAFHDNQGRLPAADYGNKPDHFVARVNAAASVKLSDNFSPDEIKKMSVDKIVHTMYNLRVRAVKNVT